MKLPTQDEHILAHDINDAGGTADNNGMPPDDDAWSAMNTQSSNTHNTCTAVARRTDAVQSHEEVNLLLSSGCGD
jgi:hypothetical protein